MSEKSRYDLRVAVAEQVMGWHCEKTAKGGARWYTIEPDGNKVYRENTRWKPDESISACWVVLEHFAWPEYRVKLERTDRGGWRCHIKHNVEGGSTASAVHRKISMAVCLAAYKSVMGRDFDLGSGDENIPA